MATELTTDDFAELRKATELYEAILRSLGEMGRSSEELRRGRELLQNLEAHSITIDRLRAVLPLVERLEKLAPLLNQLEKSINVQRLIALLERAQAIGDQ